MLASYQSNESRGSVLFMLVAGFVVAGFVVAGFVVAGFVVAGFVVARRWATILTLVFTSGCRIVSR